MLQTVGGLSAEFGVNLARVYAIRKMVAQPAQDERVPPGCEEVTLVAPRELVEEFRRRIAKAKAALTIGSVRCDHNQPSETTTRDTARRSLALSAARKVKRVRRSAAARAVGPRSRTGSRQGDHERTRSGGDESLKERLAMERAGYSRREVAELCRVTVVTVDRWARTGVLPRAVKVGPRRVLFPAAAVRALLAKLV
jgi:excisionase family DNA binding protein